MSVRHDHPQAAGDPVYRVVVDRRLPAFARVAETCLDALQHFGVPYRVVDLASTTLGGEPLHAVSGVLLAHDGVGASLGHDDAAHLAQAVAHGCGVVALDGTLGTYPAPWTDLLGACPADEVIPCPLVRVTSDRHPVTHWREPGDERLLGIPVSLQASEFAGPVDVLLDTGTAADIGAWATDRPVAVAANRGQGRVVQFLASSRLWLPEHLGHGNGLTDVLWRSLVWAARKPFLTQAMPPFVTTRLDNVTGAKDGFAYLDSFIRRGYVAVVGLYLRKVGAQEAAVLRDKVAEGTVECSAHSMDEDCRNLIYGRFDLTERTTAELTRLFSEVDATFAGWGIDPARVVNPDWGIISHNAVPLLRERGQTLLMKPLRLNRAMYGDLATVNDGWRPRPFGRFDLVADVHPDAEDFYVATVQLPRGQGIDFLQGCPMCGANAETADSEACARHGAAMIRHGLDNLMFGCLLTHEERVYRLADGQLDEILDRIDALLGDRPRYHRGYDECAAYARSRDSSHLAEVRPSGDGLAVTLAGHSDVTQYLQLFDHPASAALEPGYVAVPPLAGSASVLVEPAAVLAAPDGHALAVGGRHTP